MFCLFGGIVGYASKIPWCVGNVAVACWRGRFVGQGIGDVWCAVPLCLTRMVWKEHNRDVFEGLERPTTELKLFQLCALYDWLAVLPNHSSSTLFDFIDGCSFFWCWCSLSFYYSLKKKGKGEGYLHPSLYLIFKTSDKGEGITILLPSPLLPLHALYSLLPPKLPDTCKRNEQLAKMHLSYLICKIRVITCILFLWMLLVVRNPHSVWHLFQKNYLIFYLSFCRINLVEVFYS